MPPSSRAASRSPREGPAPSGRIDGVGGPGEGRRPHLKPLPGSLLMLPFLIPAPDLEPDTGPVGSVHLPYGTLLGRLGRPNLEAGALDGFVAWGFIAPGGGGF